jgi:CheY-like chemotaxis protein
MEQGTGGWGRGEAFQARSSLVPGAVLSKARVRFQPTQATQPIFFAIWARPLQAGNMTQPLALVLYEKLLPGSQLVNRLQDMGYRVLTVPGAEALVACAEQEKPMIVLADLAATQAKVFEAIAQLKEHTATTHLPVIAFAEESEVGLQTAAREAGATLVVNEAAILSHLEHFLDRALHLD